MRHYRKPYKERVKLQLLVKFIVDLVVVAVLAVFIVHCYGSRYAMVGNSMNDTINHEEVLLIDKATYSFEDPSRFDVVLFEANGVYEGKSYLKRIIGLPGEKVLIQNGKILVNGMDLLNDISDKYILTPGLASETIVLGKDEYFVLGDNRNNSEDSRFYTIGNVKKSQIVGKAWLRVFPLDQFSIIK